MLQDHTNGEFVGIGDCRVTRARPAVLSATVVNNDYTDESATSTQFPASYPLLSDGLRIRGMLSRLDIEMRWSRHGKRQGCARAGCEACHSGAGCASYVQYKGHQLHKHHGPRSLLSRNIRSWEASEYLAQQTGTENSRAIDSRI